MSSRTRWRSPTSWLLASCGDSTKVSRNLARNGLLSTVTHAHRIRSSRLDRLCASRTREVDASLGTKRGDDKSESTPRVVVTQRGSSSGAKGTPNARFHKHRCKLCHENHRSAAWGSDVTQGTCSVEVTGSVIILLSMCSATHTPPESHVQLRTLEVQDMEHIVSLSAVPDETQREDASEIHRKRDP